LMLVLGDNFVVAEVILDLPDGEICLALPALCFTFS
jgi:hypothetical protein